MKAKNHEKLAGFGREFIDSKISEKPVKSRTFGDFEDVKNAPPGRLLSERPRVRIAPGVPKSRQQTLPAFRPYYYGKPFNRHNCQKNNYSGVPSKFMSE